MSELKKMYHANIKISFIYGDNQTVYDINTGLYRDVLPYTFPFADKMKKHFLSGNYQLSFDRLVNNHSQEAEICVSFLLKYIVYSLYAAEEVGFSVD